LSAPERRGSSTLEEDYEYGRRVEVVIAAPGALKRLSVGVVVPPQIDAEQQRRLVDLVEVAAGIDAQRGDAVSVQSLSSVPRTVVEEPRGGADREPEQVNVTTASRAAVGPHALGQWLWVGAVVLLLAILGAWWHARGPRRLSAAEREKLLHDIRQTLNDERPTVIVKHSS
jgi:flagellar M-ring protein FliF